MNPSYPQPVAGPGCVSLRLLGTRIRLEGPAGLVELFELMFGWFVEPTGRHEPEIAVRIRSEHHSYRVSIAQETKTSEYRFENANRTFGFLYARILDQVTRRDPDLVCIHAAALSRAGRGIALAAPSRHGKSTLALSLAARGFSFLSDEVAPIRADPLTLLPFPMAIGCRPGTDELLSGTPFANHAFEPHAGLGKTLYDPSAASDSRVEPAPLQAVFFIEPTQVPARGPRSYRLLLDRPAERLVPAMAAIDGVVSVRPDRGGETLLVEIDNGAWVAPAVEGLLESQEVIVCDVEDLNAPKPDFEAEPRLSKLSTTEGVLSVFRHLRGFAALQDLVRARPGGFGRLLTDLAEKMQSVGFYHLTPGRLPLMIDQIESVLPACDAGAGRVSSAGSAGQAS